MQPFEAEAERERERESGRVVIKRKHQGGKREALCLRGEERASSWKVPGQCSLVIMIRIEWE
jgi:hypothetical protein